MAGQDPRDYTYIGSDNDYEVCIGKYHVEHNLGICSQQEKDQFYENLESDMRRSHCMNIS